MTADPRHPTVLSVRRTIVKLMLLVAAAALSLTAGSALAVTGETNSSADPILFGGYAVAPTQTVSPDQWNAQYQESMRLSEQFSGNGGG
jgi:hypothetical protein